MRPVSAEKISIAPAVMSMAAVMMIKNVRNVLTAALYTFSFILPLLDTSASMSRSRRYRMTAPVTARKRYVTGSGDMMSGLYSTYPDTVRQNGMTSM